MATLSSSPPPVPALTREQQHQGDQLDDEISSVRAEIAALTKRQSLLSSALLSSTNVQSRLRQHYTSDESLANLLNQHSIHTQTSAHQLAFGITSFPFTDPSPDTSNARLLGIRFDICKRSGELDTPYYVLLRRNESNNADGNDLSNEYRVHRHTIPALVPLEKYEDRYLPTSDEGYGSEDSLLGGGEGKQNLMGFATAVRNDLTSWQMRKEAVELCREMLEANEAEDAVEEKQEMESNHGVQSIEAVAVDAYFIRIVWRNGRVGRIKIADDGTIQKAAVFRTVDGGDEERCQDVERILLGGSGRVEDLIEQLVRLREVDEVRME